jgi:replicative DNA helicase
MRGRAYRELNLTNYCLNTNQKANQPGPDQMGKMPPQALELEEAILGALMLEKNAISLVLDVLKPESFYKESHKEIYRAVVSLFEQSQPVDLLTVTNQLRSDGQLEMVGGPAVISELTNKVGSTANIEYHARIVAEKHILRELIRISGEIQGEAFKDTTDVFDLLDKAEKELFDVTQGNLRSSYESMNELITKAIRNIEERPALPTLIATRQAGSHLT